MEEWCHPGRPSLVGMPRRVSSAAMARSDSPRASSSLIRATAPASAGHGTRAAGEPVLLDRRGSPGSRTEPDLPAPFPPSDLVLQRVGGPLADQVAFELGQDRQHPEDHLAAGRGGVDPLGEGDQVGPGPVEPLGDGQGVPGGAGQAAERVEDQRTPPQAQTRSRAAWRAGRLSARPPDFPRPAPPSSPSPSTKTSAGSRGASLAAHQEATRARWASRLTPSRAWSSVLTRM
jgi:hypothetical protein